MLITSQLTRCIIIIIEVNNTRIFFRHTVCRDDPQQLAQACLAHTVSLLQRTLPEALYRVRPHLRLHPWSPVRMTHLIIAAG